MDLSGLSTQNLLRDYHYETREQIRKNYPRNSYRIMDYETAHMNELLQHQSGKEKQGGMKRRGGGGGGGKKKPGGKKHRGGGGGGGKKKQGGKKRRGGGGGEEGSGTGDGNNDSGLPEGGGNPGDREDGPPVLPPDTERKRRGFSVPDVSFDATTVAAVVMGGGDLHVQAYVRDDKGGVSMVEPLSLLQGPHGANEDGMVQVARSYLPTVRKMAEYVVPGITPGQVLVLAANAAFVTSEAVNSHRRRDSGHSTGPTAILGPSQIACPVSPVNAHVTVAHIQREQWRRQEWASGLLSEKIASSYLFITRLNATPFHATI